MEGNLSWCWSEVWQEQNIKAFTIAKMTSATLLDEVHQSLAEAMRTGQPFEEWRREAIRKLEGRWLGRTQGELWDELPPAEKAKRQPPTDSERNQVIKESRLTTIFTTNMLSAYQAGRYQQLQESVEEYPYWRYKSMGDSHVRPAHRALNGKVFRADDPFWASHYPPNGFNCRCSVEPLDDYDLKLDGLKVERGKMKTERDEEGRERSVYIDADGKSYPTDPGWSYNPGEINGPLKVFSEQKFTPSIQRQVDKDLESIRQLDSDYRSQVERRREAESQERRQLAERLEEARRQAELQAKARAEAAEAEAAKRREQEERESQRLVAESERQVAQEQKRQAQEEREIADQAKRQSAQILRREKQEAKRQQEALANLERAAQKERRQEAKARAQEEALAQRLVERSQKEREEEAHRLEEVERKPDQIPVLGQEDAPITRPHHSVILEVRNNPQYAKKNIVNFIRNDAVETAVIYDYKGNPLAGARGDASSVDIVPAIMRYAKTLPFEVPGNETDVILSPDTVLALRSAVRGSTLIHNHPSVNGPLSWNDVNNAFALYLQEIQAVTPTYTYTIRMNQTQLDNPTLMEGFKEIYRLWDGFCYNNRIEKLSEEDEEIYNNYLISSALEHFCKKNDIYYEAKPESADKDVIYILSNKYGLKMRNREIDEEDLQKARELLKSYNMYATMDVGITFDRSRDMSEMERDIFGLEPRESYPRSWFLIDHPVEVRANKIVSKMRAAGRSLGEILRFRAEYYRKHQHELHPEFVKPWKVFWNEPDETNPQLQPDSQPS